MLFALVYLLLRRVVWLIADSSNEPRNTDVELVVLRHQLKVLKRQVGRPVFAVATGNPDSAWVSQQARNLAAGERLDGIRFMIRDCDTKFSGPFDEVICSEGVRIAKTPIRAPRANANPERWVRTVRTECLDWMLVLGRRHLERVLRPYAAHLQRTNAASRAWAQDAGPPARSDSMASARCGRSDARRSWRAYPRVRSRSLRWRSGVCVPFRSCPGPNRTKGRKGRKPASAFAQVEATYTLGA